MHILSIVVVVSIYNIPPYTRSSGTVKCGHAGGNVKVTMWTTRYSQGRSRRLVVVYKEIPLLEKQP